MIWSLVCLSFFSTLVSSQTSFTSAAAGQLFDSTFYPKWKGLYLTEGSSNYPMPATSSVQDLLPALSGIKGIAVSCDPATTVSEGQGYALFAAGMSKDLASLKGLAVAWQAMIQGYPNQTPVGGCCGNSGICHIVPGTDMPAWRFPLSNCAGGCTGSAPDGDEDALVGLIYLAELTNDNSIRQYAVKSIVAFIMDDLGYGDPKGNSRPVPVTGQIPADLQTMWLWRGGSCWGGYDTSSGDLNRDLCINPSYFSPGQWRLFRDYMQKYSQYVPSGINVVDLAKVVNSSIVWGYNLLQHISCNSGLVTNWWSLPNTGWPWAGRLFCANSGTAAGAYGADACRIPWRVALDGIWYPQEAASTPLFNESGSNIGTFGGVQYSNRWSKEYIRLMTAANSSCPAANCVPYYNAVPMLGNFSSCTDCPAGFQASAWNAWGYLPPISTFTVPISGLSASTQQAWLDLFVSYIPLIGFPAQYYDMGQEIITSAIMGGKAWKPV